MSRFAGLYRPGERRSGVADGLTPLSDDTLIVHFSSVAVYGSCITPGLGSFERPNADYPYAREKLALERYARRTARRTGRPLVVLRLGHVYGAEQWLSRFVLDRAERPDWALPFDGALSSNAIHVGNVVAGVRALLTAGRRDGSYNLFDHPRSTWREVFDWNTSSAGVERIPGLDVVESRQGSEHFRRVAATPLALRMAREVRDWLRSAPASLFNSSPALKTFGFGLLAGSRAPWLEQRAMKFVSGSRVPSTAFGPLTLEPFLFSDAAPGPALEYAAERGAVDAGELAQWYAGYSSPDSLLL